MEGNIKKENETAKTEKDAGAIKEFMKKAATVAKQVPVLEALWQGLGMAVQ